MLGDCRWVSSWATKTGGIPANWPIQTAKIKHIGAQYINRDKLLSVNGEDGIARVKV
jgi:hypothetical protein